MDEKNVEKFNPLVSIIIPVYNGANYMREAIDSALAQTYKNIEVIVVNDGSTDNTEAIAKSYGDKIRYFSKENGGVATALNLAIEKSEGEYISWLSHDDIYYPHKIKVQIDELTNVENKNTIMFCNWEYVGPNLEYLRTELLEKKHEKKKLNKSLYPLLNGIVHGCSLLIKKNLFLEAGLFDIKLKTTNDYDLFFDIFRKYPIKHVEDVLLKSRDHPNQGSKALSDIHIAESETLWEKIINSLTKDDIEGCDESYFAFYEKLFERLNVIGCPKAAKLALMKAFVFSNGKKNIIFTTANKKGGMGRYTFEITEELSKKYNILLLSVENRRTVAIDYKGVNIFRWTMEPMIEFDDMFSVTPIDSIVRDLIFAFNISLVHINGFLLLGFNILKVFNKYKIPVIYTVHDFHLICLSQHLIDNNNKYCGICKLGKEKHGCLDNNYFSNMFGRVNHKKLLLYRKYVKEEVIPFLDYIIYPSRFTKDTLETFYFDLKKKKNKIISHGMNNCFCADADYSLKDREKIRVGIVGNIDIHKGIDSIRKITEGVSKKKCQFILFGYSKDKFKNTIDTGEYDYRHIIEKLKKYEIDLALIISECPEAFSYTLSECLCAGIPVIVNGIGAQAERVNDLNGGWIVNGKSIAKNIVDLIDSIYEDKKILFDKKRNIRLNKMPSVEDMGGEYIKIYEELFKNNEDGSNHECIQSDELAASRLISENTICYYSQNLQIGDNDLVGNKFNGHDLHLYLKEKNINSKQLVWNKESDDENTCQIARNRPNRHKIYYYVQSIQRQYSLNGILNPIGYDILLDPLFLNAGLVHLHLIHNYIFDIQLLPLMSRMKPIVWTLHDPWSLGGHCIHHFECEKWKTHCTDCSNLKAPFSLQYDNSALNFALKKDAIKNSKVDIIVASQWMKKKVEQSPIFEGKKISVVPFGINQEIFRPLDKLEARKELGVPSDAIVMSFRYDKLGFKGLDYIDYVVDNLRTEKKIVLLVLKEKLERKNKKYDIREYGWVNDDNLLSKIYSASDVFLMPSVAEAFGMMAIEAMSCGTLPIVLEGTALPDTVNAPDCGVSTNRDKDDYLKAVQYYIDHEKERKERSDKCLEFAKRNYNKDSYVDKIIKIYEEAKLKHELTKEDQFLLEQLKKNTVLKIDVCENSNVIDSFLTKYHLLPFFLKYKDIFPEKMRTYVREKIINLRNKK